MPLAPGSNKITLKEKNTRMRKSAQHKEHFGKVYSDVGGNGGDHCTFSPEEVKKESMLFILPKKGGTSIA